MKKDPYIDIHKERDLLDDLWMHLKGDYHANILNLRIFMFGIIGLKYSWMLKRPEVDILKNKSSSIITERTSPTMRLGGNKFNKKSKKKEGKRNFQMQKFNTSPMRNSVSKTLRKYKKETSIFKESQSQPK